MAREQVDGSERRKCPRRPASIPAQVKIVSSSATGPIEITDVMIRNVGLGGLGLMLSVSTKASEDDFAKLLARRRECRVSCRFPGSDQDTQLVGTIVWVHPRRTARGVQMLFGIELQDPNSPAVAALKAFVEREAHRP